MTDKTLDEILELATSYLSRITEAEKYDGSVGALGCSYNHAEAGGYFRAFVVELNELLPKEKQLDIIYGELADDDDEDD